MIKMREYEKYLFELLCELIIEEKKKKVKIRFLKSFMCFNILMRR